MRKIKITRGSIFLLVILVFLLCLSACGQKPDPRDQDNNQAKPEDGFWSEGDLVAIGFLGYCPTGNLDIFRMRNQYQNFVGEYEPLFDSLSLVYGGQYLGDEVYFILPRFADAKIIITDAEDESIEYYQADGSSAILLLTNLGDLRPDSKIKVIHEGRETSLTPMLSGMDSSLILNEEGFIDISPAMDFERHDPQDRSLLEGSWLCSYENVHGDQADLTLIFSNYEEYEDGEYHDLVLSNPTTDTEMDGWCYSRGPIDFADPGDDERNLLYFDLTGPSADGRFQMFGKFDWELIDPDFLQIMHYSWDPLMMSEENYLYYFKRVQ